MTMKIVIFGITGSIGTQTVKICNRLGYKIVGCSYHSNKKLAAKLIKENRIPYSICTKANTNYEALIRKSKPDIVVNALVGFAGLDATITALKCKKTIALANKESVVVAGKFIFDYAKKHNIKIIPIDSEHTNLYYQLVNVETSDVNQIYITGSGGKILNCKPSELKKITYKQATTHSNWKMGNKITIDSGTLINKCFEVIEAYWYFKTKRINVLWDKTSLIHSAILLNDGSFFYSHSLPNMTLPITWAINNFKAPTSFIKKDAAKPKEDVLQLINHVKPISFAYDVINDKTYSLGITINAANEVAHKLFKAKKIRFDQIVPFVEKAIKKIKPRSIKSFADVKAFDKYVRKQLTK